MESKKSLNIFENTNYSFDRRESQSLVIDVDRTSPAAGDSVEFKVKLVEPLIIDKQSNVYLDSLTTFKCLQSKEISKMGFLLSIDDFPIKTASNNENANRSLYIPNEQTGDDESDESGKGEARSHKGKKMNFVCTINPMKITNISGKLSSLNGSTPLFADDSGRFIIDLSITPR